MSYYDDDVPETFSREQVAPIAKELLELRREKWTREAIEEHPELAGWEDMLGGEDRADFMRNAEAMSERISGAGVGTPTTFAGPPVIGGSPALAPKPNEDEEFADIKRRARAGDERAWQEAFHHLRERARQGR